MVGYISTPVQRSQPQGPGPGPLGFLSGLFFLWPLVEGFVVVSRCESLYRNAQGVAELSLRVDGMVRPHSGGIGAPYHDGHNGCTGQNRQNKHPWSLGPGALGLHGPMAWAHC